MPSSLKLGFGLTFLDLHDSQKLRKVDQLFCYYLSQNDHNLLDRLLRARKNEYENQSDLILSLGPFVESFFIELFNYENLIKEERSLLENWKVVFQVKKNFIQRYVAKKYPDGLEHKPENLDKVNGLISSELTFAKSINTWMEDEHKYAKELEESARYSAWVLKTKEGKERHKGWALFSLPKKINPDFLIPAIEKTESWALPYKEWRARYDFSLTDEGFKKNQILDQAHYCLLCHHRGKDSCSKGFLDPKENTFQKDQFGAPLEGCPLEEKISEMNELRQKGYRIAALATIMIDNPLVAATGHRICNDCMKACIYQKQEPVNIPAIETETLKEILYLPWGFEVYSLLSRWNPLNFSQPLPLLPTNRSVLVAGMGPAGFTLSHYLLNLGHTVIGIDALKIEPLEESLSGVTLKGEKVPFEPIKNIQDLFKDLKDRAIGGFGGVAEYGITARWNKNFLTIIRLLLERRSTFSLLGGIRLGGTLTTDQAFQLGFDHVALCLGAGQPTNIPIKNSLAKGVRQASDFLMALQLTGAFKRNSLANLQIRLPIIVIGGGLTAVDTATEALAYYPIQVEKFYERWKKLIEFYGEEVIKDTLTPEEYDLALEMNSHSLALASRASSLEKQSLLNKWGGATLVYRKKLQEAPSYRLNPEELSKALEEGIQILDEATPKEIIKDANGYACGLGVDHPEGEKILKAHTIFIAAGTKPNITLQEDEPIPLREDGYTLQALNEEGEKVQVPFSAKRENPPVITRIDLDQKSVSFLGDLHPSFSGNVVKAMASAKKGVVQVNNLLLRRPRGHSPELFLKKVNDLLRCEIVKISYLAPKIVEIVISAPLAAKAFKPGQFYRFQNFEKRAPLINDTHFVMEGIALTGAEVDQDKGLLSTIMLEMGGSSNLSSYLKIGDPIILMGPTGKPTEIPENETVLLVGGGLGNAVLFSIGRAMREKGGKVLYVAGYRKNQDRFKIDKIEEAADCVIWCCDEAPNFSANRSSDFVFHGSVVEALLAYGKGNFNPISVPLGSVDRMIVIGSDGMMAAVNKARKGPLAPYLKKDHLAWGSINSPMQCMMKGICGQCIQRHVNPLTGTEKIVYSCKEQDQLLDLVDFNCLKGRLSQNSLQEKITRLWINFCKDKDLSCIAKNP